MPTRDFPVPVGRTTWSVSPAGCKCGGPDGASLAARTVGVDASNSSDGRVYRYCHVVPGRGGHDALRTLETVGAGAGQVDPAHVAAEPVGRPVWAKGDAVLVQAELGDVEVRPAERLNRKASLVETKDQEAIGMTGSPSAVTQYLAQERGNITRDLGPRHIREPCIHQPAVGPRKKRRGCLWHQPGWLSPGSTDRSCQLVRAGRRESRCRCCRAAVMVRPWPRTWHGR